MEALPELTSQAKFTSYDNEGHEVTHDYGKVYEIGTDLQQIKIAASANQVDLLLKLADKLTPPFYILYVLVTSRLDNKRGRYQSTLFETKDDLVNFLLGYKEYFETDGRHHIWVCTLDDSGKLIYDRHNVIYGYGQLENYISILKQNGYKEERFDFPAPHAHSYIPRNDKFEERILQDGDWDCFPLTESDEY